MMNGDHLEQLLKRAEAPAADPGITIRVTTPEGDQLVPWQVALIMVLSDIRAALVTANEMRARPDV